MRRHKPRQARGSQNRSREREAVRGGLRQHGAVISETTSSKEKPESEEPSHEGIQGRALRQGFLGAPTVETPVSGCAEAPCLWTSGLAQLHGGVGPTAAEQAP